MGKPPQSCPKPFAPYIDYQRSIYVLTTPPPIEFNDDEDFNVLFIPTSGVVCPPEYSS